MSILGTMLLMLVGVGVVLYILLRRYGVQKSSIAAGLAWSVLAMIFILIIPEAFRSLHETAWSLPLVIRLLLLPSWLLALPCVAMAVISFNKDRWRLPTWMNPWLFLLPAAIFSWILFALITAPVAHL